MPTSSLCRGDNDASEMATEREMARERKRRWWEEVMVEEVMEEEEL